MWFISCEPKLMAACSLSVKMCLHESSRGADLCADS